MPFLMISKNDIISDVINNYPETFEVFLDFWLSCVWCSIATVETIEEWASAHWMSEEDIDRLVQDLNEVLTDKK